MRLKMSTFRGLRTPNLYLTHLRTALPALSSMRKSLNTKHDANPHIEGVLHVL